MKNYRSERDIQLIGYLLIYITLHKKRQHLPLSLRESIVLSFGSLCMMFDTTRSILRALLMTTRVTSLVYLQYLAHDTGLRRRNIYTPKTRGSKLRAVALGDNNSATSIRPKELHIAEHHVGRDKAVSHSEPSTLKCLNSTKARDLNPWNNIREK